jgi:hypothetical protein
MIQASGAHHVVLDVNNAEPSKKSYTAIHT